MKVYQYESVIKIKEKYGTQEISFSFTFLSKGDILKAIKSLSSNNASPIDGIHIKILENSIHIFLYIYSEKLSNIFNECLINQKFPDTLKKADVTPIFKIGNNNEKENYSPMSMLSACTKVFEKLLFEQINDHMQSKFSKHLTSFSQKPQHSKCKTILNKKFILGALFMDLSNCLIP